MNVPASAAQGTAWRVLDEVCDPEIPALTIADLGILRDVRQDDDGLTVVITPTYTGCPAMRTIEQDILAALHAAGYGAVRVVTQLAPAWTTDWLSEAGRTKLLEFGIAPPQTGSTDKRSLMPGAGVIACPHCRATDTEMLSEFGSTACKALYRCRACREPFDYFKCL